MEVYRTDKHRIDKPSKIVEREDGYEVTSNDGTMKIELRHATVMEEGDGGDFYHTVMWIKEGNGWTRVSSTESFPSKESFIDAISKVEEFSQAILEYKKISFKT